jgi:hypothetical protein
MLSFLFTPSKPKTINPGAAVEIRLCSRGWFKQEFPELPNSNAACRFDASGKLVAITCVDTGSAKELVRQVTHELLKHASPNHALLQRMTAPGWDCFSCGPRLPT